MDTSDQRRTSVAKAGWLVGLVFAGWLIFLLGPADAPDAAQKPPATAAAKAYGLAEYGLEENPDLEMLPAIFKIWADEAEWENDQTRIAYWHPGLRDYGYFFEVARKNGRYRFKPIGKPAAYDEQYADAGTGSGEEPLRLIGRPRVAPSASGMVARPGSAPTPGLRTPDPVSVEVAMPPIQPVAPDIKVELPPKK